MPKFFKWSGICLGSLIVLAAVLYFAWPQLYMVLPIKFFTRNMGLEARPISLKIEPSSITPSSQTELSLNGIRLQFPREEDSRKTSKDSIQIKFKLGGGAFFGSANDPFQELLQKYPSKEKEFKELLPTYGSALSYDLEKASLSVTPADISIFDPMKELDPKLIFLLMKENLIVGDSIKQFELPNAKGFVFSQDKGVMLDIFLNNDKKFVLILSPEPSSEELNYILSSIRQTDSLNNSLQ